MGGIFSFIIIATYVSGLFVFWSGYKRTNFSPNFLSRLYLSLAWPILFAVNASYRRNFKKALRGY
ncbi:MAG: hypothetical protein VKL42_07835 [Snowella sp.]|nr:hypothetical protein [Snowella sp.]